MTWYIGVDVHLKTSTYCVLDTHGKELKCITIRGGTDRLIKHLQRVADEADGPVAAAFEASLGYGPLHDQLKAFCSRVRVAHAGRLKLIFQSKRKNDRVDARNIAKLLFLDELPQVHVPKLDVRAWRELIEFRKRSVDKRTRCKNSLRALLRGQRIASPKNLWTKAGLKWLEAVTLPTELCALRRDILIDELASLERQIRRLTDKLDTLLADHPGATLLMTISGVGPRTAEAFLAYVDDPNRFARVNQIGAYLGLVPCQDASANVNRLGHMTKDGPATVRKYLVEAAWRAIRCCPAIAAYFERLTHGRKERRKTAVVATAHKLSRIMLTMLKTGETYRPQAA